MKEINIANCYLGKGHGHVHTGFGDSAGEGKIQNTLFIASEKLVNL